MFTFKNAPGSPGYFEEVAELFKQVTDHMTGVDEVFKQSKMGVDMIPVFHCNHSGLHLPPDWVKEWGVLYGIGLGPDPLSEVLDTEYHVDPPAITPQIRSIEQIMHPVRNSKAQVDLINVPRKMVEWAVLAKDDPFMEVRAKIVRANQLVNPKGKLKLVQAAWAQTPR